MVTVPRRNRVLRAGRRRNAVKAKRRVLGRHYKNTKGFLKIIRKCPEFWLQNTGAGTARLAWIATPGSAEVNYTGTVMKLGTGSSAPTPGMNGAYDIPFACSFALSDIINYLDVATLADKYRIKSVYIRVIPNFSNNPLNGLFSYPSIQYVTDDDDANVPTVAQLREKMGVKVKTFKPGQYVGIKIKWPKIQTAVQDSAGGIATANMRGGQWLNSSNVNVPHLALKGMISNMDLTATTTSKISFKFDVAYVIEAKEFQ